MKIIYSPEIMQKCIEKMHKKNKKVGFVPTMGYLHQGHLSLIRKSVKQCDITVLSIYVNPTQFGPKEDYKKYPRDIKNDLRLAKKEKVDYVFIPSNDTMYPEGFRTNISVSGLSKGLCGKSRPGHFDGVATVVLKLFNIVNPDKAYFGQKDAQQAIIIKRMVKDLNLPVKIVVMPIIRESDGLAMSSRNKYLNIEQRKNATILYKALKQAKQLIAKKQLDSVKIISSMKRLILRGKFARIDYIAIVDAENLSEVKKIKGKVLIALAVFIGKVRLIDNIIIKV